MHAKQKLSQNCRRRQPAKARLIDKSVLYNEAATSLLISLIIKMLLVKDKLKRQGVSICIYILK